MQGLWSSGDAYDPYVGRWSRLLAPRFLAWAGVRAPRDALDVGCGTGALSDALFAAGAARVEGIDRSPEHVASAASRLPQARFRVGDAQKLDFADASFDAVVSGLVLNFVPDAARAAAEMRRVARPGGVVAAYVWDYEGRMEMMRQLWDAAAYLDPKAREHDEGLRSPLCRPDALRALWENAGLRDVDVAPLDQPTPFRDFDDYWRPFLAGHAPAPAYVMGLPEPQRVRLRELLRARLPIQPDGSIPLVARAWAVKGRA